MAANYPTADSFSLISTVEFVLDHSVCDSLLQRSYTLAIQD